MSDQGEKTCPLCMEEMDLTDQQLKPCKCGYEICVWCWHQIMDLAEKEDTEGRCPACRTLYDKEKIVGTASNGRLVAEINSERRLKSQKTKPKASDGRKHLSSVRVIQHNLVYIIGIPSDLADEELLQHKEYFGQYGKVQKVSIARTAGGAIQHSVNNTCSVYITYLREEEAVRCIQSVHGYVLDGKPLRACFGTTKYCHAWLRNMSCSNPDCLYLHEFGSQDDSFTKDETISDYTRNRVQQITGTTNNMQRRSGNMLPPPVDDFCISSTSSSVKPIAKSVSNSSVSHAKGSPPNGSSGRSIALPAAAAWGLRVSNGRPPVSTPVCLGGVARQKTDTNSSSFPAVGTSAAQGSTLHLNVATKSDESGENLLLHPNSSSGSLESSNHCTVRDSIETISDSPAEIARGAVPAAINSTNHSPRLITSKDSEGPMIAPNSGTHCTELDRPASSSSVSDRGVTASLPIYTFCNGLSSVGIDEDCRVRNSDISSNGSVPNLPSLRPPGSEGVQKYYQEHFKDPLTSSLPSRNTVLESDGDSVSRELFDWREDPTPPVLPNARSEADDVLLAFDDWRSKVSENGDSSNYRNACSSSISGSKNMIFEADETFCQFNNTGLPNGYHDNKVSSSNVDKGKYFGSFKDDSAEKSAAVDMGESSIISNILSMDPDIWGDSLTSPHDLVKLLSENDKQHTTLKLPSSLKVQNSNQSRFSFARQEDFANQGCDLEASLSNNESMRPKYTAAQDCFVNRDPFEKLRNGFSANMFGESDTFSSNLPVAPHSKHSVSRTQISAPPGFSFPNRAPPPGFSSQERMDQAFESFSGNNLVDSSFLRNQYVGHPTGSFGSVADVELIDPAILAVGKGRLPNGANSAGLDMRSAFTTQQSTSENDPRYFLMQQQISGHQNLRYPDHVGDRFSSFNDAYRGPSRLLEQSQVSNFFPFGQLSLHQSRNGHISNGHWDGWNEVQSGNELGMAELLRNERLGLNKHLSGYEDLKFRMPTSSDIYSRAFGI